MKTGLRVALALCLSAALVACGGKGPGVGDDIKKASEVTDARKQQEIIEKVSAVSFADLSDIDMAVTATAKIAIISLNLEGSYVTSDWGTPNAKTNLVLNLTSPLKVDEMMKSEGNGAEMTISTQAVEIKALKITLLEASGPTRAGALIHTNDPEVVKKSLIAELTGMESEDYSKIRILKDSGETKYFIDVKQEKFMELIGQFGLQGLELNGDPTMGFSFRDEGRKLSGIQIRFAAKLQGLDAEVELDGKIA